MPHIKKLKKLIILICILFFSLCFNYSAVFANENILVDVYAPAAILMESTTGKILYSKNANQKMYPASTTKIMTAILTLENCNLSDIVTVSHNAIFSVPVGYSNANLQEGEELTVEQLLNVLLIPSANDAAFALAEHIAGSVDAFSDMMNKKAEEIGCKNTHFVNPNGIHNENHYSTAYDLALIGNYAMKFDTYRKITTTTTYTLPATNKYDKEDRIFSNTNDLIKSSSTYYYPYITGGKTGYTDAALNCIVTTAQKNDMELTVVILHDERVNGLNTRSLDCKSLFEYGFDNYIIDTIVSKGTVEKNINIENGTVNSKNLDLIIDKDVTAVVPINFDATTLTSNIVLNEDIKAPIHEGDVLGTISYYINNETYSANLVAAHSVAEHQIILTLIELISITLFLIILSKFLKHINNKKRKKRSVIKEIKNPQNMLKIFIQNTNRETNICFPILYFISLNQFYFVTFVFSSSVISVSVFGNSSLTSFFVSASSATYIETPLHISDLPGTTPVFKLSVLNSTILGIYFFNDAKSKFVFTSVAIISITSLILNIFSTLKVCFNVAEINSLCVFILPISC